VVDKSKNRGDSSAVDLKITPAKTLSGATRVPGDKSISHRAVMLGALAHGDTCIENFLPSEDCLATVRCLNALGVKFTAAAKDKLYIHGQGLTGLTEPFEVLDAGNSGTTMRLLAGILAGQPFFSILTGDASLCRRPMGRVVKPLTQMGAKIWGRQDGNYPPLSIRGGKLKGIHYTLPVASAQVKSAILLAGLFAAGKTSAAEPVPTRDHTERMLKFFKADISLANNTVQVEGGRPLAAKKIYVPGDISAAAFFLVAGAIVPKADITLTKVGINPTRTGIIEVLKKMGADITIFNQQELNNEPFADLRVKAASLKGVSIGGKLVPRLIDEIPILAVAAACAHGDTIIRDAAELKVKESNRLATVAEELRKFGVETTELADGLIVRGGGRDALQGAECFSHKDHRIAMAMAVAGLAAQGQTLIKDTECIATSFPDFEQVLNTLRTPS
jgi:3-phosphoshikimate 1-carboxyvinyltransferase